MIDPQRLLRRRAAGAALLLGALGLFGLLVTSCLVRHMTQGERLARAKCGACHLRPAPGQRSRDALIKVLEEHRRRFELSAEQRAALIDYLAPKPAPGAPATPPPR